MAADADPPVRWSETENVRWKVKVPGRGNASPIVWEDRVYLLTARDTEPVQVEDSDLGGTIRPGAPIELMILALERDSGRTVWSRIASTTVPHEETHARSTWASASAATDGETVIASFGSNGVFAYDLDGHARWHVDLGDQKTRGGLGEGSSPAIHGDRVVVVWDHDGDSFIVALDKRSGEVRWRRERDEPTSWSTPLVVEADGLAQVIVSGTHRVRSYDLATGDEVWSVSGLTENIIPTPGYAHGLVYVMSGFRGYALKAIRVAGARGDLDGTEAIVWTHERDTSFLPSGIVHGDAYYFLKNKSGILTQVDARSGEVVFGPERIEGIGTVYASLVGAAGRIYVTADDGTTVVLEKGPELRILATNTLDDGIDASPAIAGGQLFLRSRHHLYCLEKLEAAERDAEPAVRSDQRRSSSSRRP